MTAVLFVQGYDLKRLKFPPIVSWTEAEPHLTRQIVLDVIALCAVVTVVLVAVFANLTARTAATESATTSAHPKPTVGDTNSLPANQGGSTTQLDAKTAVLSVEQLPDYRLVSSTEAVRPGGVVPNSWDSVFQKSHAGSVDYRMAEAIVVVYGTTDEAIAGVDLLRQAEESQGAKALPAVVGSESTTWVEPLQIPGYEIVRVVFRTDNVVAQIAILGKNSPLLSDDVKVLASAQQTRLVTLVQGNA